MRFEKENFDELNDSMNGYECQFVFDSKNCTNCAFVSDCTNCTECIFCTNLNNRSFCIENIQLTKEDYFQKKEELLNGTFTQQQKNFGTFMELRKKRILLKEYEFYQKMRLPIPRNCPDCRHKARLSMRNPRKLFSRTCLCTQGTHTTHAGQSCGTPIQTTYAPDRPEKVYCEKCYLEAVY